MDLDKAKHSSPRNFSFWLPCEHHLPALRLIEERRSLLGPLISAALGWLGMSPTDVYFIMGPSLWLSAPGAGPARAGQGCWYQTLRPVLVLPLLINGFPHAANAWIMDSCQQDSHFSMPDWSMKNTSFLGLYFSVNALSHIFSTINQCINRSTRPPLYSLVKVPQPHLELGYAGGIAQGTQQEPSCLLSMPSPLLLG